MSVSTKAGLKALRERVGLSQQSLADALGVTVKSVKRWEHENQPNCAPPDAWDVLEDALDAQRQMVKSSLVKAKEVEQDLIPITYYRDQRMYLEYGRGDGAYYGRANATARAIGAALEAEGYEVEFRYPGGSAVLRRVCDECGGIIDSRKAPDGVALRAAEKMLCEDCHGKLG